MPTYSTEQDLDNRMFSWFLAHGLEEIKSSRNYVRELLHNKAADVASETDDASMLFVERLALFDTMHVTNAFLSVYAYLEEMLYVVWKFRAPDVERDQGNGLSRYKPILKVLGLRVGDLPCWKVLLDAEQVRHCLSHANGRIGMMAAPEKVAARLRKYPGEWVSKEGRIEMRPMFLGRVTEAIEALRQAAFAHAANRCS